MADRGLKIGLYADSYRPGTAGGVDSYFVALVRALTRYAPEHAYHLIGFRKNADALRHEFADVPVTVHCLNPSDWGHRIERKVRALLPGVDAGQAFQINRLGLDLVVFPRNVVWVGGLHTPVALHLFDIQHEYYGEFFPPATLAERQKLYRDSVARADVILVAAHFTQESLHEKLGVSPERVRVVFPGIGPEWFPADDTLIAATRAKYDLPPDFLYYPANPWIHKNHGRLMAALRVLREREGLTLPAVFTGRLTSEAPGTLQRLALAAGVEDQVTDLGFVPQTDLRGLYGAAQGVIFPSLFEGFGLPVLEAMACGCPVACADATSLPEVAGDAALLFDPVDQDALIATMGRLWSDAALRDDLRGRGLARAAAFTWERSIRETTAAYEGIGG